MLPIQNIIVIGWLIGLTVAVVVLILLGENQWAISKAVRKEVRQKLDKYDERIRAFEP
jgi:hypothetical protein